MSTDLVASIPSGARLTLPASVATRPPGQPARRPSHRRDRPGSDGGQGPPALPRRAGPPRPHDRRGGGSETAAARAVRKPTAPPGTATLRNPSPSGAGSDMDTVQTTRHPPATSTWRGSRSTTRLRALKGSRVAVRVVERGDPEMLLAVFIGASRSAERGQGIPRSSGPSALPMEPAAIPGAEVHFERDGATTSRMSASTCAAIASRGPWDALGAPCWRSSRAPCSSTSVGRSTACRLLPRPPRVTSS